MTTMPIIPAGRKIPGVAFSTTAHVRSHGKEPRGRGAWMFCPMTHYNAPDYLEHCAQVVGGTTYTEAKRAAAAHFGDEYDYLVVCP